MWQRVIGVAAVAACLWFLLALGIGHPFNREEVLGLTQQRIREVHGAPAAFFKRNGNDVWVYHHGLILKAATEIAFKDGAAINVRRHSPMK